MAKNSLKTGPDELGYYGEGASAMGGMAVGETLMPAWFSVLPYVCQHGKWVAGSTCSPGLISARATGDARAGAVLARAGADLGRAATAPVGLPRRCRCTDPSIWVGWARVTPQLAGAAPYTVTPRPTAAQQSKTVPKSLFAFFHRSTGAAVLVLRFLSTLVVDLDW